MILEALRDYALSSRTGLKADWEHNGLTIHCPKGTRSYIGLHLLAQSIVYMFCITNANYSKSDVQLKADLADPDQFDTFMTVYDHLLRLL